MRIFLQKNVNAEVHAGLTDYMYYLCAVADKRPDAETRWGVETDVKSVSSSLFW